jgi:hypothetical protein
LTGRTLTALHATRRLGQARDVYVLRRHNHPLGGWTDSAASRNGRFTQPLVDCRSSKPPVAADPKAWNPLVLQQPVNRAGMAEQVLRKHRNREDLIALLLRGFRCHRVFGHLAKPPVSCPLGFTVAGCLHSPHHFDFLACQTEPTCLAALSRSERHSPLITAKNSFHT